MSTISLLFWAIAGYFIGKKIIEFIDEQIKISLGRKEWEKKLKESKEEDARMKLQKAREARELEQYKKDILEEARREVAEKRKERLPED